MKQRRYAPDMPMPPLPTQPGESTNTFETPAFSVTSPTAAEPTPVSGQFPTNRNYQMIPVALIDENPFAPREVYTPDMIEARAKDLEEGQHDPIHVIPNPEFSGRYIIADGWTRVIACKEHAVQDALLAEIHSNMTPQEASWFGYDQNEGRQQQCDLDRGLFYEKQVAAGLPAKEIATRTGLKSSTISSYRLFAKLPKKILDFMRENADRFPYRTVRPIYNVVESCGEDKALALAHRFVNEDRIRTWLEAQADALTMPKTKRGPSEHREIIPYANGTGWVKGLHYQMAIEITEEQQADFDAKFKALLASVGIKNTPTIAELDSEKLPGGGAE